MDVDQAIEIVTELADGVDPTTGERLPPSSAYEQGGTLRALHLAFEGLDRLKRVKERVHSGPPKAGRGRKTKKRGCSSSSRRRLT